MDKMKQYAQYNPNLLTLKCVLFLFFGALGALLPFVPLQMTDLGLSRDEAIIVSSVSPIIALLGPLVAAPLADRLAGGFGGSPRSKTGRYLTVMISTCCLLSTIFYWLLITIPPIVRSPPSVSFMCHENGGFILQDRCGAERTCYDWVQGQRGAVMVKNCIFDCNATSSYRGQVSTPPPIEDTSSAGEYNDYVYDIVSGGLNEPEIPGSANTGDNISGMLQPYPHMCYANASGGTVCEVYTEDSLPIRFTLGLRPSVDHLFNDYDAENTTELRDSLDNNTDDTCKYPFDDQFGCRIPASVADELKKGNEDCRPMVVCEIHDPYNNTDSLLRRSQCGFDNIGFWLYLTFKSLGDLFVAAAVALLGTAVVIATRETSTGRGDIGKQFAVGALGLGIFAPIVGGVFGGRFFEAIVFFTVLLVLAVLILLVDRRMPLSPPEWWWHTRCGLLALPMSSVRKYGPETAALAVVLLLLGVFWNAIDSFLPWHVVKLTSGAINSDSEGPLIVGLTISVGALPAVIFLFFAETIVDYCGHSNVLIFCFVNYICHHLALMSIDENARLLFLCEALEVFTLHMMYVTAVLYLRHLVPRKLTACGQALPVIAHFCFGRCIGALLGAIAYSEDASNFICAHQWFAVAATVVAFAYFVVYHFYLKTKCGAPVHLPPDPAPAIIQSMNGNGSYTPLRVYHNSKSKKGHFRY
ncbi:uncharacterized protein LOC132704840 isoform X2 [Cylas formicarius]|uniref:uncharacterized protein LOC132704840 isoform X2 n=1 Tax=Cylas formicarius TaxID=197179 RepID=UPI0029588BF8|nr:uncharacterized protein LOC132704840 isoform X2 [Cylas formicarius]